MRFFILLTLITFLFTGCSSNPTPPKQTHDNICLIYQHDRDWEKAAKRTAKKWGTPEYILMAFIHQESRFRKDAQPDRDYALGLIPLPRSSSAYGYAQAQDPAWYDYQRSTKRRGARRTDIYDAMDFIGWYNYQSYKRNGINRKDTYNLYLAYHEGQGGYSRKTYKNKSWLIKVAKKVTNRAQMYKKQLWRCNSKTQTKIQKTEPTTGYKNRHTKPKKNEGCNAPWPYC